MSEEVEFAHRRILLTDDNPAIHEDFGKIFGPGLQSAAALAESGAARRHQTRGLTDVRLRQ